MNQKNLILFIIIGLIVLISFFGSSIVDLLTDWYWFKNVGFTNIFTTILFSQIWLGIIIGVITFVFIYINLLLASRFSSTRIIDKDNPLKNILSEGIKKFIFPISLIIGFLTGLVSAGSWEVVLKYFNSTGFNITDPIFGRDISYYFFKLPFIQFLLGIGFWIIIISFIGVLIRCGWQEFSSIRRAKSLLVNKFARIHISLLVFLFFALMAVNIYFVKIPSLLYSSTGLFTGASYTDIHALLPFLKLSSIIALIVAIIALVNIVRPIHGLIISSIGLYIIISLLGGWAYPALLQRLVVLPNELVKETPYIKHHIAATQRAFGLDQALERDLLGETTLDMSDINNNQSTIRNVRLWDREPLLDTFGQIQEIRTYYDFVSVDNDRYTFDGDYRQVLLSPRELNSYSLPQRNFINEHLTFTHGFGLTLSPVNEVTPEGLPVLFLKDLPPVSTIESLSVNRPEIYYGELSNEYVVVNTKSKEFDYPSGDENVFTNYKGTGGVKINSFFKKLLFAVRFKSLKILLSNDITKESKIMYYRDIENRVKRVLPFVHLDGDPYLVVTKQGRLKWIYDAYTVSSHYPYAQLIPDLHSRPGDEYTTLLARYINYIRNSVKIVLDVYDGDMKFYIADKDDPLIQTYAQIFKGSFALLDEMDDDLRSHIRYPEDLFTYQTNLYTVYHMDEVQIFYNKEDQWEIPRKSGYGRLDPMMRHMIMRLPEEKKEEFILMIPFTPRGKNNLAAWMVARNDGEHYGQLVVYRFPKQKLVFGPTQITNRINQDTEISRQLTLWDQRGSQVIRGNLLVIPIEESLIYVQPIYLRAEGGRIPELKRVIVAYQNQIAMEETLNLALERIFSGEVETRETPEDIDLSKTYLGAQLLSKPNLIEQAQEYYTRALEAQRKGNWAVYGEEIKKLGKILKELNKK